MKIFAFLSSLAASYAISVRQASVLPAASSGFHLAMDTLAVRLTIPPAGFVEDFHLQVNAPCRAHKWKACRSLVSGMLSNPVVFDLTLACGSALAFALYQETPPGVWALIRRLLGR